MTSRLSTGISRTNSPAYCKKNKFIGIDPMVNGLPRTLTSFASYRFVASGFDIDANEVINLRRNVSGTFWSGFVTDGTDTLTVNLTDQPTPGEYEMELSISRAGVPITSSTWSHIQPPGVDRWDTGTKTNVVSPGDNEAALHIMG